MKDKTFIAILAIIMVIGTGVTAGLMIHGYNLWKEISIVEMIANWG
ncbi:MAG: hypothetical protein IIT90_04710 [Clostridiales bacterium]|jgi:hypothetical protein|nr:hypothetical protein [Clostridiales bacterium]MBQ5519385.1 hypothetical protein [Clostridiales bacterium]